MSSIVLRYASGHYEMEYFEDKDDFKIISESTVCKFIKKDNDPFIVINGTLYNVLKCSSVSINDD